VRPDPPSVARSSAVVLARHGTTATETATGTTRGAAGADAMETDSALEIGTETGTVTP
jgi:hypothetical protein